MRAETKQTHSLSLSIFYAKSMLISGTRDLWRELFWCVFTRAHNATLALSAMRCRKMDNFQLLPLGMVQFAWGRAVVRVQGLVFQFF